MAYLIFLAPSVIGFFQLMICGFLAGLIHHWLADIVTGGLLIAAFAVPHGRPILCNILCAIRAFAALTGVILLMVFSGLTGNTPLVVLIMAGPVLLGGAAHLRIRHLQRTDQFATHF